MSLIIFSTAFSQNYYNDNQITDQLNRQQAALVTNQVRSNHASREDNTAFSEAFFNTREYAAFEGAEFSTEHARNKIFIDSPIDDFKHAIQRSLYIIYKRSPNDYMNIKATVRRIFQDALRSGAYVDSRHIGLTFRREGRENSSDQSCPSGRNADGTLWVNYVWCASVIFHDAIHIQQYLEESFQKVDEVNQRIRQYNIRNNSNKQLMSFEIYNYLYHQYLSGSITYNDFSTQTEIDIYTYRRNILLTDNDISQLSYAYTGRNAENEASREQERLLRRLNASESTINFLRNEARQHFWDTNNDGRYDARDFNNRDH